jgi:hypothetical protein
MIVITSRRMRHIRGLRGNLEGKNPYKLKAWMVA